MIVVADLRLEAIIQHQHSADLLRMTFHASRTIMLAYQLIVATTTVDLVDVAV